MSSTLICPACQGEISLPAGLLHRVECPHCQNELCISADMARATDDIPPQQYVPAAAIPRAAPVSAAQLRRAMQPSNRPSAIGQLAGILLGGVMGMVVGYWTLNYLGGPRFDFLHIPLPMVPHTQQAQQPPHWAPQRALSGPLVEEEEPPPPKPASAVSEGSTTTLTPQEPLTEENSPPLPAFPSYSTERLVEALAAAHAAAGCQQCQSTGFIQAAVKQQLCNVCGGKPARRINADVYAALCHLSEVITFADVDRGDPELDHRKQSAERVFLQAASDREKQAALGRMASHRLGNRQRQENGILLAGTVQSSGQAGDYSRTRLVLFGLPHEVIIVATLPLPYKSQSRVIVAGSIVDAPQQRLPGYTGLEPQLVVGGLPLLLPDEER